MEKKKNVTIEMSNVAYSPGHGVTCELCSQVYDDKKFKIK